MSRLPKIGCLILLIATAAMGGCQNMVAPPSPELRSELKTIGLLPAGESPLQMLTRPVEGTGSATAVGAGQGALTPFAVAAAGCTGAGPFGCALGLAAGAVLAPVGAVIGAGVGASKSHSTEEVEAAHEAIASVISKTNPNEGLAAALVKYATENYGVQINPMMPASSSVQSVPSPEARPKYALRLAYDGFAFDTAGRIDPDISLKATAVAEIILLGQAKPVYKRTWGYQSDSETYFALAANQGALLKTLLETSQQKIATTIARDLFEANEPSPIGPPRTGTVWTVSGPLVGSQGATPPPY